jgi:hypothetical protein
MARGISRWRMPGNARSAGIGATRTVGHTSKGSSKGSTAMSDVIYVGLTVLVFIVLGLLVWGVERFER